MRPSVASLRPSGGVGDLGGSVSGGMGGGQVVGVLDREEKVKGGHGERLLRWKE